MAKITKPHNFQNGTKANANEVNANFDTVYNEVNGNLDSDNVKDGGLSIAKTSGLETRLATNESDISYVKATKANMSDVYDKATSDNRYAVKSAEHTHSNKSVLDKLTQSGTETSVDISKINLLEANKADKSNTYDKATVDTKVATAESNAKNYTYDKASIDAKISPKANSADVYDKASSDSKYATKTEVGLKANTADVYDKTSVDNKLSTKANTSDVYTKTQSDAAYAVKSSEHTHSNKSTLDKLSDDGTNLLFNGSAISGGGGGGTGGDTITDSTINGNILKNGSEIQVYDETALANRVTSVETNKANSSDVYTKTQTDTALAGKENAFTKNTAFNKNFGSAAGTVAEGNHNHSGVYEPVITKKTGFNLDLGTTAGTVAQGNHTHDGVYIKEPASKTASQYLQWDGTSWVTAAVSGGSGGIPEYASFSALPANPTKGTFANVTGEPALYQAGRGLSPGNIFGYTTAKVSTNTTMNGEVIKFATSGGYNTDNQVSMLLADKTYTYSPVNYYRFGTTKPNYISYERVAVNKVRGITLIADTTNPQYMPKDINIYVSTTTNTAYSLIYSNPSLPSFTADQEFTIDFGREIDYKLIKFEFSGASLGNNSVVMIKRLYVSDSSGWGKYEDKLALNTNQYWQTGSYGLHAKNSDLVGLGGLFWNDACDQPFEGLNFLKSSATPGSTATSDYDNVKALDGILYVNDPFQSGTASVVAIANTVTTVSVTFSKAYTTAPIVVVTPSTTVPQTEVQEVSVGSVSTTGFIIYIYRTTAVNTVVNWMAMPKTQ